MIALTAYAAHICVIAVLGMPYDYFPAVAMLTGLTLGSMLFATLWMNHFRRGPLEQALYKVTQVARRVK
ncbi:DUF418 domain-containing protein [Streptomyces minutiscleroticus]